MDDQKTDRMIAKAAARALERGHGVSKRERPAPMPKRAPGRSALNGRDVDALLERVRSQRLRRTWNDQG
jgi:hypothetical protein